MPHDPMMMTIHWPMIGFGLAVALLLATILALFVFYRRPARQEQALRAPLSRIAPVTGGTPADSPPPPADAVHDMLLVIPDISGYTDFMSHSRFALRHAQYVVGELLTAIAQTVAGRMSICRPEGDSLLLYRSIDAVEAATGSDADLLVDILAAFYERRRMLHDENICQCRACQEIDSLQLKMIVHRGEVMETRVAGFETLAGVPVIVAHRLLKNSVGSQQYVLVTEPAESLITDLPMGKRRELTEAIESVGSVRTSVFEFEPDDLPTPGPEADGSRAVKVACDLCRKVSANLKDMPSLSS